MECCTLEQPFVKTQSTGRRKAGGGRFVNSIVELGKAILEDRVDRHPRLVSYSAGLRKLCSHGPGGCLSRIPSERPTASELLGSVYFVRAMERFLRLKDHLNACPSDLSSWIEARIVMAKMTATIEEKEGEVSQSKQEKTEIRTKARHHTC